MINKILNELEEKIKKLLQRFAQTDSLNQNLKGKLERQDREIKSIEKKVKKHFQERKSIASKIDLILRELEKLGV